MNHGEHREHRGHREDKTRVSLFWVLPALCPLCSLCPLWFIPFYEEKSIRIRAGAALDPAWGADSSPDKYVDDPQRPQQHADDSVDGEEGEAHLRQVVGPDEGVLDDQQQDDDAYAGPVERAQGG